MTDTDTAPPIGLGKAVRAVVGMRGLVPTTLVAASVTLIPSAGSAVGLLILTGYLVSYQRRVWLGEAGLPPLGDFGVWIRRSIGYLLVGLPLIIAATVASIAGAWVMSWSAIDDVVARAILLPLAWPVVLMMEIVIMRYSVYDRIDAGLDYAAALRAIGRHWRRFLPVPLWIVVSSITVFALQWAASFALRTSVRTPSDDIVAAIAEPSVTRWTALGVAYAVSALLFLSNLGLANLVGQAAAVAYPIEEHGGGAPTEKGTGDV